MLKKLLRSVAIGLVALMVIGSVGLLVSNLMSNPPSYLGVKDGRLTPAFAAKPNNVSSYEAGAYPKEAPLAYTGAQADAKTRLIQLVGDMPRTTLETDNGDYLHFTVKTRIFRFVDDIEFLFDDENKQIHFRSAARTGHSDMSVNQKRMAEIRGLFE